VDDDTTAIAPTTRFVVATVGVDLVLMLKLKANTTKVILKTILPGDCDRLNILI